MTYELLLLFCCFFISNSLNIFPCFKNKQLWLFQKRLISPFLLVTSLTYNHAKVQYENAVWIWTK